MYNYDKIMKELNTQNTDIYEPRKGDILIGKYVQDVTPSGMSTTYIELKQENNTLDIEKTPVIEHKFIEAGILPGDHIAIRLGKEHKWKKWNITAHNVKVLKLTKVNGEYE